MNASSAKWVAVKDLIEITTTFPDDIIADDVAEVLVMQGLVACAQVSGPIQSTYLWKGKYEQCREHKLSVKTTKEHMLKVVDLIRSRHPYEVPEITAWTYEWMMEDYARWIMDSTANPSEGPVSQ